MSVNRRDFLTATLGAAAATACQSRQLAARMPSTNTFTPTNIRAVCHHWFMGDHTLESVADYVNLLMEQEWRDLPTIPDKQFRKLIVVRPDLKWCRVVSPRISFDIYEANEKRSELMNMPVPPPAHVPVATLPINYYLRNGAAPDRLAYGISQAAVELCRHAHEWFANEPQFHDYAVFVSPAVHFKQEAYMLEMFCYYHVFGSTDETREELLASIRNYDHTVQLARLEKCPLSHLKEIAAQ